MPEGAVEQVFVDLSDVATDEQLGVSKHRADLSRWDRLKSGWVRTLGQPQRFWLVADESLRGELSRGDRMRYQELLQLGAVVVVSDPQGEILRHATQVKGIVLSNDRFMEDRGLPDLDTVTFMGWVVRGDTVLLTKRPLDRL